MGQGFLQVPFDVWFGQAKLLFELIALIWVVGIIDLACLNSTLFAFFAQRPRTIGGFFYLPISGLFHADWSHLTGNTVYLLLFGLIIILQDPTQLLMVTIVTALGSGWGLWLLGRRARYLGSSGVLFGYIGFVTARAILEKELVSAILLSWLLFSFFFGKKDFYPGSWEAADKTVGIDQFFHGANRVIWRAGDSFWGIFPGENPSIGWDAHLFGLASGVFAAQYRAVLTPWVNQIALWVQQILVGVPR